jgi:hypothetical protein
LRGVLHPGGIAHSADTRRTPILSRFPATLGARLLKVKSRECAGAFTPPVVRRARRGTGRFAPARAWRRRLLGQLNKGRNSQDHSRGRVWHRAPDSTPAATHSPREHIATEGHTAVVPGKQTELRASAVAADRSQNRRAEHSGVTNHKAIVDHKQVAGHTRPTAHSRAALRNRAAVRSRAAVGLRPRLRRETLHWRRTAPRW